VRPHLPNAEIALHTPTLPSAPQPIIQQHSLIVADPITEDKALYNLSAGVGRWLHFTVGGQAELGATPFWMSTVRGKYRLGKQNLQLSVAEAEKMAKWTGGTHFAVGTLSGEKTLSLTYRIHKASQSEPIGAPITLTGTAEEITQKLPMLARQLSEQMGVTAPRIPDKIELSTQELNQIGAIAWTDSLYYTSIKTQPIRTIAEHSPVAGTILLTNYAYRNPTHAYKLGETLFKIAPDHPFVFMTVGEAMPNLLQQNSKRLETLRQKYPNNYCYTHAGAWVLRFRGEYQNAKKAAEHAVKCAPLNPDAWLLLGATISDSAEAVRKSRFLGEMTAEERKAVFEIYPSWEEALKRANAIDPGYAKVWFRLSTAAAFNGNGELADTAFWKAQGLQTETAGLYWWGFELYQPKWYGDPEKLKKVAEVASQVAYSNPNAAIEVIGVLRNSGFPELAKQLARKTLPRLEQAIREHADDGYAHYDYARTIGYLEHIEPMLKEYREAVRLLPEIPSILDELTMTYLNLKRPIEAEASARELVQRHPNIALYQYRLGFVLHHLKKVKEAEAPLAEAMRLAPKFGAARGVYAQVLMELGRQGQALAEYEILAKDITDWSVQLNYAILLVKAKQPDKAISILKGAEPFHGSDVWLHITLSDAYLQKKDFPNSAQAMRQIVRLMPKDGEAHLKLGNRLLEAGYKSEARKEWKTAQQLDPKGDSGREALQMLNKTP
jgi:tetratricopeptide (TPR) repeat protein